MTPAASNRSETPTGSQELAAILREIAKIEEAPDYMGPKTNRAIKEAEFILGMANGIEYVCDEYGHRANISIPDDWMEDVIVGEIGRACDARGWGFYPEISTLRKYSCVVWRTCPPIKERFHAQGESLALAAARAYLAAIQETRE